LRLIQAEILFFGTLTQSTIYPREVLKRALQHNAASVIFAHNHPTGSTEPSAADEASTRRLKEVLALIEVQLQDHIIVAGHETRSFAEWGLL
jgi:DNA repair protein RadC